MDTYLQIAARILETERRPLSPKTILDAAYRRGVVPPHLHGKTQHKTLQARISEDIIERRDESSFFRTEPGKFFLRRFLADETLPEEFRTIFPARRRIRELVRGPALALERDALQRIADRNVPIGWRRILKLLKGQHYHYDDPRRRQEGLVFVRSFVCIFRKSELLCYRAGRYRENRDSFMLRRSIGFSAFVDVNERTLFNFRSFGIIDAGVNAARIDLDIPDTPRRERISAKLSYFIWPQDDISSSSILAVINFECPSWFEPTKRRLALNDLCWLDTSIPINDIDDFDPWSKLVLLAHYKSRAGLGDDRQADFADS